MTHDPTQAGAPPAITTGLNALDGPELRTDRLVLRRWREADLEPFSDLNADLRVMEHFPARLTREQSDAMVERIECSFEERGFGLWATEVLGLEEIVSFTAVDNVRSQEVMRRLGMRFLARYDHPIPGGPSLPSVAFHLPGAI